MPVRIIGLALACDNLQYTVYNRSHVISMRLVSFFCSIGTEGLRRYVDTHLHCSSAAPIGPRKRHCSGIGRELASVRPAALQYRAIVP
jgi:hypothetical protein